VQLIKTTTKIAVLLSILSSSMCVVAKTSYHAFNPGLEHQHRIDDKQKSSTDNNSDAVKNYYNQGYSFVVTPNEENDKESTNVASTTISRQWFKT